LVVLVFAVAALLALVAWVVIEGALTGAASLVLRLSGHPPPRKSRLSRDLDELEQRLRGKEDP
jgi:hypothetical protein